MGNHGFRKGRKDKGRGGLRREGELKKGKRKVRR